MWGGNSARGFDVTGSGSATEGKIRLKSRDSSTLKLSSEHPSLSPISAMGNKDEVVGVGIRQERMIHNETEHLLLLMPLTVVAH
jgi:hypothetical protein